MRENNMRAYRVGERPNCPRGDVSLGIGMNAYVRKAPTKARLEEPASGAVKGLPGRTEHVVHDAGYPAASGIRCRHWLELQLSRLCRCAASALATDVRRTRSGGALRARHAHNLVGNAVRLILERIIGLPESELRLYNTWPRDCGP
jgi:hypothetical protein